MQDRLRTPVKWAQWPAMTSDNNTIHYKQLSWNFSGLLDKIKYTTILREAHNLVLVVPLLQETHFLGNRGAFLEHYVFNHAGFTRGSRGVTFPLMVVDTIWYAIVRYVVVTGFLFGIPMAVVSVYIPPTQQATMMKNLMTVITSGLDEELIVGGISMMSCTYNLMWMKRGAKPLHHGQSPCGFAIRGEQRTSCHVSSHIIPNPIGHIQD